MRISRMLLAGALVWLNAGGCGGGSGDGVADGGAHDGRPRHTLTHVGGTTTIVGTPQRVVALGPMTIESLLAIGVRPAAITEFSHPSASQPLLEVPPYLAEQLEGLPTVGGRTVPDIEAVIAQRPDVVLGTDDQVAGFEALSHAAPTVLFSQAFDWRTEQADEPWRVTLRAIGALFDRAALADQRLAEYDTAAASARAAIHAAIGDQTVLLVRTLAKGMRVHGRSHGTMGHVLYRDLGLRPPAMPAEYADQYVPMEQLVQYDPDHIFLIRGNAQLTEALLSGPIWDHLKAVRSGHVYDVHLYWIRGHGWYGKMAIVEDALRHLTAGR